jgi:hypothetical protein
MNSAAACIWNQIQQGRDPTLATREIAASLAIDHATALAYTQEMIERWHDLKVLDNGQPQQEERSCRPPCIAQPPGDRPLTSLMMACRRYYMVLGTLVSLGFPEKRLEETVHPTLCHLEVSANRPVALSMDVVISPGGYEVRCNGAPLGSCVNLGGVAPLVNAHMLHLAIGRLPHVMALHSGAVVSSQGCLLMPARSGSGKSTLTAALCRAGWGYMADDIVLLQDGSLNAVGVPNALGIKAGAWKILESFYPELATITIHDRSDGQRIRYVPPPIWVNSEAPEARYARWIVFPRHEPRISAKMSSLSTAEGFCRLMANCCGLPRRLTQQDVDGMIRWIGDIPCFELTFSDLDVAVRVISAHCVPPASTTMSTTPASAIWTS